MRLNEAMELPFIKFKYQKPNHDAHPRVKVLDFDYKGIKGQKTYGKRSDILGFNVHKARNSKKQEKALDDIAAFARFVGADNKEKYNRIKDFNPEALKFIRRYNKEKVSKLKLKKGWFWHSSSWEDCKMAEKNQNIFSKDFGGDFE